MRSNVVLIFLSVFFFYAVLYVWIEDVLQAEPYHFHIRIVVYTIVFGYLSYFFMRRAFKNHFKQVPNKKIIFLIIASLLLAYSVQFAINNRIEKEVHEKKIFLNPLYAKYKTIAEKYNLDLTFTKYTKDQRGPVNYKINPIYSQKPKSIDILFIGDSSIAWNLIPEVVEQLTNKKVAVFAYESNPMTEKTAKLFDMISQYYLKDDGIVIVSFANYLYQMNPNTVLISKKEYKDMASWNIKRFTAFAKSKEGTADKIIQKQFEIEEEFRKESKVEKNNDSSLSLFQLYQEKYNMFSQYLAENFSMRLNSVDFYTLYLEEYINPEWNKKKNVNIKNDTTMYLRWNMRSITLHDPNFNHYSLHSEIEPTERLHDKNTEKNAKAAASIYGMRKIFMVPIYDSEKDYELARNIYETYYKRYGFELCDLGLIHPINEKYLMQDGAHIADEGGLLKSILIGEWLKEKF